MDGKHQIEWGQWDGIHEQLDQAKRIESARKAECTPLAIYNEEGKGEFSGNSGQYETWLTECMCFDFEKRSLPCKHMYRLAMELGLIDVTFTVNKKINIGAGQRLTPEQVINAINACDIETCLMLSSFLHADLCLGQMAYSGPKGQSLERLLSLELVELADDVSVCLFEFKRNDLREKIKPYVGNRKFNGKMKLHDLIEWIKTELPETIPEITCDYQAVTISPKIEHYKKKAYSYLNDRFRSLGEDNK